MKLFDLVVEADLGWGPAWKHGDPFESNIILLNIAQPRFSTCQKKYTLDTIKSRLWQTALILLYTCEFGKSSVNIFMSCFLHREWLSWIKLQLIWKLSDYTWLSGTLASYFRGPCFERLSTSKPTGCREAVSCILSHTENPRYAYIMSPWSSDPSAKIQRQHSMCWTPHPPLIHFPSEFIIQSFSLR